MDDNSAHLSVLYFDEIIHVWRLFYYNRDLRIFEEIQEDGGIGQLDSIVLESKTGFEMYHYYLTARGYKKHNIRTHRRAHKLFKS
jgi:hypothetical protein